MLRHVIAINWVDKLLNLDGDFDMSESNDFDFKNPCFFLKNCLDIYQIILHMEFLLHLFKEIWNKFRNNNRVAYWKSREELVRVLGHIIYCLQQLSNLVFKANNLPSIKCVCGK